MINLLEALVWLEGIKANGDGSGKMDISDVELMLHMYDQECEFTIADVVMWHPEERYIRVREENFNECNTNDDGDVEDRHMEIYFDSTDAMEVMHLALGSLLRRHYETQLDKMK